MKRQALLKHLRQHGCELFREGANHSIFWNPTSQKHPRSLGIWKSPTNWHARSVRTWGFPRLDCSRMDVIAGTTALIHAAVIPQLHPDMAENLLTDTRSRARAAHI